ncbi:MAG: SDR family NAD(P)-dependent oxidoreductase, partial [Candidatus Latescibacteria bacterium]|nr:SDR family NAD(P)-dependent oxidoreductase [Candidatus Latescibacterota bacterium]
MKVTELLNIKGRTAIVTGGAGLYGKDIATGLLEAGCRVILASRNLEKLEETKEEFGKQGYGDVACYRFDQGDVGSIEHFVKRVYEDYGEIDILVNNSVVHTMKGFNGDIAGWEESFKVNATGTYCLTRAIGNRMVEAGKGSIISIASIYGVVGPDRTHYVGTDMDGDGGAGDYYHHKAGLINLTRHFASKYGQDGIRVNCISPGGRFFKESPQHPKFMERYNKRTFLGRMADEDDIK